LLDAVADELGTVALAVMDDDVVKQPESQTSIRFDEDITLRVVHSWSA
jgi:hypothetical protein